MNIPKIFKPKASEPQVKSNKAANSVLNDNMPKYNDLFIEDILKPGNIKNAIDDWRQRGLLLSLNGVMDLLLDADDNLQSKLSVRVASIKKANWSIKTEIDDKRRAFYDALIAKLMVNFAEVFVDGKVKGHQFQQIQYENKDGLIIPTGLSTYQNVDLRKVQGKLVVFEKDKPMDLPPFKFMTVLYHRPVLQSLLKYYLFYSYALNNWSQFAETYGKPLRLGKYDQAADAKEIDVLRKAVKSLGTDQAAIVSKSTEIEFVDFAGKQTSQSLYGTLCQFMIDRITTRILGQTMTTQDAKQGAFAMAAVQMKVQEDIEEGDLTDFSAYMGTVLSYVDALNFGGTGIEIEFVPFRAINLSERIKIDQTAQAMGVPITQEYMQRTYNIPAPGKGETVMDTPQTGTIANQERREKRVESTSVVADASVNKLDSGLHRNDEGGAFGFEARIANADLKGIAKLLSSMREQIRACKTIEDLQAIPGSEGMSAFIHGIAADFAVQMAQKYVNGRKKAQANSTELPELRFEFDERSINSINAYRNQAYIISHVRVKESFQALLNQAAAILEEGGNFTDFMKAADLAGFAPDNPYHLKTEYDTALAATEMAGRWAEIEELAEVYPYLRYVTVGDDQVREEHKALDGYIAPVDDPFWDENYPPNGYNCRCDVEQVTASEADKDPKKGSVAPKIASSAEFKGNTGKTDQLPSDAVIKLGVNRAPEMNANAEAVRVIKDRHNYPIMNSDTALDDVITNPDTIIHTKLFGIEYAKANDDYVIVAKVYKGKVSDSLRVSKQEYNLAEGVIEWATKKK